MLLEDDLNWLLDDPWPHHLYGDWTHNRLSSDMIHHGLHQGAEIFHCLVCFVFEKSSAVIFKWNHADMMKKKKLKNSKKNIK